MIIDGKSLAYALDDNVKMSFLELAIGCASVICCRSSPKQKALVSVIISSLFSFQYFPKSVLNWVFIFTGNKTRKGRNKEDDFGNW